MIHNSFKTIRICLPLLVCVIYAGTSFAQAALDKNISRDSLFNYLNNLLQENTTQAKEILRKEAAALKNKPDESDQILALKLYHATDDTASAQSLEKSILKKFPKGITARDAAYAKIFNATSATSLTTREKEYLKWLANYPKESYSEKDQEKYNFALLNLIQAFAKENDTGKTGHYLAQLQDTNVRTIALYNAGKESLGHGDRQRAIDYLTEALTLSKAAGESADAKVRTSFGALFYNNIVDAYAAVLLAEGRVSESIGLTAPLLEKTGYSGMNSQSLTLTLAKALIQNGKKLNAYLALDKFLRKNPETKEITQLTKSLYEELNGSQADFGKYLTQLNAEKQQEHINQLKKAMINQKAPPFSLYNRQGALVSLEDFKDKIVILDFWATWCVPCVQSFPGMQATMEKYKENQDIVFLYINTWETKSGFRESVDNLMNENRYTFNILYDEPKDNAELVVKQYGVSSIPAKFIIDKTGNIRFKAAGGRTDKESVIAEMSAMIDLVLEQ